MEDISFQDLDNFQTKFTPKEFIDHIHTHLKDTLSASTGYNITKLSYDPLYDEYLPHSSATHMWSIDFLYTDEADIQITVNYDTIYTMPRYQILQKLRFQTMRQLLWILLTTAVCGQVLLMIKFGRYVILSKKKKKK